MHALQSTVNLANVPFLFSLSDDARREVPPSSNYVVWVPPHPGGVDAAWTKVCEAALHGSYPAQTQFHDLPGGLEPTQSCHLLRCLRKHKNLFSLSCLLSEHAPPDKSACTYFTLFAWSDEQLDILVHLNPQASQLPFILKKTHQSTSLRSPVGALQPVNCSARLKSS